MTRSIHEYERHTAMKFKPAILASLLVLAISVLTPATPAQPSQAPTAPGAAAVPGQNPVGRGAGMAALPRITSPEIKDDQTVVFRLRAANATDVVLNGDWPQGRGVKMTKDDQGIWSVTVVSSIIRKRIYLNTRRN
jgi:hypothetical protein